MNKATIRYVMTLCIVLFGIIALCSANKYNSESTLASSTDFQVFSNTISKEFYNNYKSFSSLPNIKHEHWADSNEEEIKEIDIVKDYEADNLLHLGFYSLFVLFLLSFFTKNNSSDKHLISSTTIYPLYLKFGVFRI